ncbi:MULTISPECIES: hypothetical protein [Burkholderia]|uniref:hypothetical protein n=1 Tax=Burkholderia TaxID=32008 RepID=UPI001F055062|nr:MULTISPECIES: hypothetical protein [Burkholderia]
MSETNNIDPETLSRDEYSLLLYAETVCVEYGGLLEGARMNAADMGALERFKADGILNYGRVPGRLLGTFTRGVSHWCDLTDAGWELAHKLRRARAAKSKDREPRTRVDEALAKVAA